MVLYQFGSPLNPNVAKAGGLQIRRCQRLAVADYGGTLGALSLKASGYCSIGVISCWISF